MPHALRVRPSLPANLLILYQDFDLLSASRGYGMDGPLPLTMQDLAAFLQMFPKESEEARGRWVRIMKRLDAFVLTRMRERAGTREAGNERPPT